MPALRSPALALALLGLGACFNDGGAPALTTEPGTADATSMGSTTADIGTSTAATAATAITSTGEVTTTTDVTSTDVTTTNVTTAATSTGCTLETWYFDIDKDGYGGSMSTEQCGAPGPGYTMESSDCDDSKPAINPGATEVCDALDNDCDGGIDEYPAGELAACDGCRAIVGTTSTYYFCGTPEVAWDPARTRCKTLLGDLVIVNDMDEHLFLTDQLAGTSRWWIGLSDIASEGQFVWIDNSPAAGLKLWANAEPDNADADVPGSADCVAMNDGFLGFWHDEACADVHGMICEAPLPF